MKSISVKLKNKNTIVITDSGLGGLSVQALIAKKFKYDFNNNLEIIFFNALAEKNYGYNSLTSKKNKLLIFDNALRGMLKFNPDVILIACNTLSTLYNETEISKNISIPVIGIVESGTEMVLNNIKKVKEFGIIILGTPTTIDSNQHKSALIRFGIEEKKIITQPCKNLETEIQNNPKSKKVKELIKKYLLEATTQIENKSSHQFVLFACTHYGYSNKIFSEEIVNLYGNNFTILNPNEKMADLINFENNSEDYINGNLTIKVLSKVKISESQKKNLGALISKNCLQVAAALQNYEYLPNLFHFNKRQLKNEN